MKWYNIRKIGVRLAGRTPFFYSCIVMAYSRRAGSVS